MFGNGPVLDKKTRTRTDQNTLPENVDLPFWSNNIVQAASILYKHNATEEFFVMGGRTGGPQYASESKIIRKKMEKLGIPLDIIKIEDQSYDTPTNHGEETMTRLGINLTDDPDRLRAALRNVPWPILSPEEKQKTVAQWKAENISSGWPEELLEKYKRLMNYTPIATSNI